MSAEKPTAFAAIRASIEDGTVGAISSPCWKVLSVLVFRFRNGRTGTAWPGVPALAAACGMSESSTKEAIQGLKDRGLIYEVARGRASRVKGTPGTATEFAIPIPFESRNSSCQSTRLRAGKSTVGKSRQSQPEIKPPTIVDGNQRNGVSTRPMVGGRKTVPHCQRADLVDERRLAALFEKFAAAGLVNRSEADLTDFASRARNCLRVGRNPAALFAEGFRTGNWRAFIAARDENQSRRNGRCEVAV